MKVIFSKLEDVEKFKINSIGMGSFDGLHKGHIRIIEEIEKRRPSVLITFSPHPRVFIDGKKDFVLTDEDEKIYIIKEFDIDFLVFLKFDDKLKNLPYEKFLRIVNNKFQPSVWVAGPDHTFGKKAQGNTSSLWKFCIQNNIILVLLPYEKAGNKKISSSSLRKALKKGEMDEFKRFTGRFYELKGKVVPGKKIGKKIGFPTVNIEISEEKILPRKGVYMGELNLENKNYISAINVGKSPTLGGSERIIEAYILDFDGEIYDREIKIKFKKFLRESKKFKEIDSLKMQIEKDVKKIKEVNHGKSS